MPKLIQPRRKRLPILPIIIVVLIGIILTYRYRATIFHLKSPTNQQVTSQESGLTAVPAPAPAVTLPPAPEVASSGPAAVSASDPAQLAQQFHEFFAHLDSQEYIRAYSLKGGSEAYLTQLVAQVLAQPPVVVGEADDHLTMIKNSAHFYHVLGPKNIALIKEILASEKDGLEPLLATCYAWSRLPATSQGQGLQLNLPLKQLYEYASFFINTLGGQSYLLRRTPDLRMLAQYYSLRIIDQANQESENRHGIAIQRAVRVSLQEIGAADSLADKNQYLATLQEIGSRAK